MIFKNKPAVGNQPHIQLGYRSCCRVEFYWFHSKVYILVLILRWNEITFQLLVTINNIVIKVREFATILPEQTWMTIHSLSKYNELKNPLQNSKYALLSVCEIRFAASLQAKFVWNIKLCATPHVCQTLHVFSYIYLHDMTSSNNQIFMCGGNVKGSSARKVSSTLANNCGMRNTPFNWGSEHCASDADVWYSTPACVSRSANSSGSETLL